TLIGMQRAACGAGAHKQQHGKEAAQGVHGLWLYGRGDERRMNVAFSTGSDWFFNNHGKP
ncbi:hypothetical protein, partial [Diaphorobacter sp.]|uniref:hypothetical protein n=1 Tax=Diaphorobacter sp. TaxID=1934310 RepID=UPI003D0BF564